MIFWRWIPKFLMYYESPLARLRIQSFNVSKNRSDSLPKDHRACLTTSIVTNSKKVLVVKGPRMSETFRRKILSLDLSLKFLLEKCTAWHKYNRTCSFLKNMKLFVHWKAAFSFFVFSLSSFLLRLIERNTENMLECSIATNSRIVITNGTFVQIRW